MGLLRQPPILVVANRRALSPSPPYLTIQMNWSLSTPGPKNLKTEKQAKNFTEISKEGLS